MAEWWVEEASMQLRLAALWRGLDHLLANDEELGGRLRAEVLAPFTHHEFWPGLNDALAGGESTQKELLEAMRQGGGEKPPLSEFALGWVEQARALQQWDDLQAALDRRAGKPDGGGDWAQLVGECASALERIAARNEHARWAAVFLAHLRHDQEVFDEAASVLRRCQKALDERQQVVQEQGRTLPWMLVNKRRHALAQELRRKPAWTPILLARLSPDWLRTAASRPEVVVRRWEKLAPALTAFPERESCRLFTLALLVEAGNRLQPGGQRCGELAQLAPQLAGPALEVMLVNDPATTAKLPGAWQRDEDAGCQVSRVLATGLLARKAAGGEWKVLRPGHLVVPPRRPEPVAQLRQLACWLAHGPQADDDLAALCEEVAAAWPEGRSVREWLSEDTEWKYRECIWRLLQRLSLLAACRPDDAGPALAVLQALARAGFRLVDAPETPEQEPRRMDGWFLVPGETQPHAVPQTLGPLVQGPDGTLFGPAFWLHLPRTETSDRPFVRCLLGVQPLLTLRLAQGAEGLDLDALKLAAWATQNNPKADAVRCRELFEHCYRLHERGGDVALYRELGLRFYRCLTEELRQVVVPPLCRERLQPLPLTGRLDGATVRFDPEATAPRGAILRIGRFGDGRTPAELDVSPGADLAEGLRAWLRLPDVPWDEDGGMQPHPLQDWRREMEQLVWQPEKADEAEAAARERCRRWLATPAGLAWFDRLARGGPAPRAWLEALVSRGWCGCYPELSEHGGCWPVGAPAFPSPEVRWTWAGDIPFRQVLNVKRFGPRPEFAACELSLGKREDRPALAAVDALQRRVDEATWLKAALDPALQELRRELLDQELRGEPGGAAPQQFEALLAAFEVVGVNADNKDLDTFLHHLRALCESLGGQLWPGPDWTFAAGQLPSTPDEALFRVGKTFSSAPPGAVVALTFGCAWQHRPPRRGRLVLSCGVALEGYTELLRALREQDDGPTRKLAEALLQWPEAAWPEGASPPDESGLREALLTPAAKLVSDWYLEARPRLVPRDADRAERVERPLFRLLEGLRLERWQPEPGRPVEARWQVLDGQRRRVQEVSAAAVVQEVLGPGLKDQKGEVVLVPTVIIYESEP